MGIKRFLFLLHRWTGVFMGIFIALWFASGIILMYVQYPALTLDEHLENLPGLNPGNINVSAAEAAEIAGIDNMVSSVTLSSVAGRPAYLMRDSFGFLRTVYADDGSPLGEIDETLVMATVSNSGFAGADSAPVYDAQIYDDQWSVSAVLHEHRPLHRVRVNDAADTVLYVSSRNGQIVRDTNRHERFWNWLGSTIHWIYPVQLRRNQALWTDVVIYLSFIGVISVVSGGIVGIMRMRVKRRYRNDSISPYRGIDKLHHVLGLACLVFVCTFMFSGLMSMSPWGMFQSEGSFRAQLEGYRGGSSLNLAAFPEPDAGLLPAGTREIEWHQVGGRGLLVFAGAGKYETSVLMGDNSAAARSAELLASIGAAIPAMLPNNNLLSLEVLEEYDNYYYSHHDSYRPLPVYRARFDDNESTWFHIDLNTAQVISRHTDASRLQRWLFNGMHSLDFNFLLQRGWLWDTVVILLSLLGLAFSVTSVIIGWRRLKQTLPRISRIREKQETGQKTGQEAGQSSV